MSRKLLYHDTGKMGIEHATILIISPVNLQKMSTEILDDSLIIVPPFAKGSDASAVVKRIALNGIT